MAFKVVVSDPKTRKSVQKDVEENLLMGKKIGEKIKGDLLGMEGYELEITGGSDKEGFPMRPDIHGTIRKKVLLAFGPGFHPLKEGQRKKKSVRGNTIADDIAQINTKVVVYGKKSFEELFNIKPAEKKHEEKAAEPKAEHKAAEHKPAEHKAEAKPAEHKPAEHKEHKEHKAPEAEMKKEEKPAA
jgi:small subunit ribosomal protein S6e